MGHKLLSNVAIPLLKKKKYIEFENLSSECTTLDVRGEKILGILDTKIFSSFVFSWKINFNSRHYFS